MRWGVLKLAKKKSTKPPRKMTKHQLTRWEKQKKRQRIIFYAGIGIIIAAILTIGVGWFVSEYLPMHETVLKVKNTEYDMGYFIKQLKAYSQGQPSNISSLSEQTATLIGRNQFIKEDAAKLGITVSDDEIKAGIAKNPQFNNDYWELVRTQVLVTKLRDEYFTKDVSETAEHRHVMAMLLESESQANEVRARLVNGEDFSTLAKELSLDAVSKETGGDFGFRPPGMLTDLLVTSVVEDYAYGSEKGVLSQPRYDAEKSKKLGYWLAKVVADEANTDPAKLHIWAMLLGSAEQGRDVKARIEKGEDFATLAKEISQLATAKDDGGDLGLVTIEQLNKPMADFVFGSTTQPGQLSDPIRDDAFNTKGGYWLIKVLDIELDRKISDEDKNVIINKALNQWITALLADPENKIDESLLTSQKKTFAILRAMGDLSK